IAVIAVSSDRDAPAYAWIEILRVAVPLLARVIFEKHLIQFPTDLRNDYFFRVLRTVDRNAPRGQLRFHFFAGRWSADELLKGVQVNRDLPIAAVSPR